METSNLPNKELKVITTEMLKELRRISEDQSKKLDIFNKELENIKKKQTELKNIITEIKKNTPEESIVDQMRHKWTNRLGDIAAETTEAEQIKRILNMRTI